MKTSLVKALSSLGVALILAMGLGTMSQADASSPCAGLTDNRPASLADNVITKAQLVFDLCRTAYKMRAEVDSTNTDPLLVKSLRTIAVEGRLMSFCTKKRKLHDEETSSNYLAHHEPGCGPFDNKETTATPTPGESGWASNTCTGDNLSSRPEYPDSGVHTTSVHSPITAQVEHDVCYAANVVNTSDAVDIDNRLTPDLIHLLDKLEYEYELIDCKSPKDSIRPLTKDADFAAKRWYGCGSYP